MVLSARQKKLIRLQDADSAGELESFVGKLKLRVGDLIEFVDSPEFNGKIYKISQDQWKMIHIDYGTPGHSKILSPSEFNTLLNSKKVIVKRKKATKNG